MNEPCKEPRKEREEEAASPCSLRFFCLCQEMGYDGDRYLSLVTSCKEESSPRQDSSTSMSRARK